MTPEEQKNVLARNLVTLRTGLGLKQTELAEKLNYTDKAVSKWERGESVPDVFVLAQIAALGKVNVDWLLCDHSADSTHLPKNTDFLHRLIIMICAMGIYALAVVFFTVWLIAFKSLVWQAFIWAFPVMMIVVIVLDSIWFHGRYNVLSVSALLWGLLVGIYVSFISYNLWPIFFIGVAGQPIIILTCYFFAKARKAKRKANADETGKQ